MNMNDYMNKHINMNSRVKLTISTNTTFNIDETEFKKNWWLILVKCLKQKDDDFVEN